MLLRRMILNARLRNSETDTVIESSTKNHTNLRVAKILLTRLRQTAIQLSEKIGQIKSVIKCSTSRWSNEHK